MFLSSLLLKYYFILLLLWCFNRNTIKQLLYLSICVFKLFLLQELLFMYLSSFGMIYNTRVLPLGNDMLYYINIAQLSKKSGRIDMNFKILPDCRFGVKLLSIRFVHWMEKKRLFQRISIDNAQTKIRRCRYFSLS